MTCLPDTIIYYFLFVLGYSCILNVVLWWVASKFEDKYNKLRKRRDSSAADARFYKKAYCGLWAIYTAENDNKSLVKRLFS